MNRLTELLHVHWHCRIFACGIYGYEECRCGHRQAVALQAVGYSPLDHRWLEGGPRSVI